MNFDKYGIIGQIQNNGSVEGGDSVNWMGHLLMFAPVKDYAREISDDFYLYMDPAEWIADTFGNGFGGYARNPNPDSTFHGFGAHYNHPWDGVMSRDQLTGLLGVYLALKNRAQVLKIAIHALAWLWLFSYNTRKNNWSEGKPAWKWPDLTGPDIWSMYLRGTIGWFSWPFNILFDLHMLFNTLFYNRKDENDPISFGMKMYIQKTKYPTPISWLAFKLLNKDKLMTEYKAYWEGHRDSKEIADGFCRHINRIATTGTHKLVVKK